MRLCDCVTSKGPGAPSSILWYTHELAWSLPWQHCQRSIVVPLQRCVTSSEIMPRTANQWDPHIQTMRADCMIETERYVYILFIKHAKNLQKFNRNISVIMAVANHHKLCPVDAMWVVHSDVPTVNLSDPLFMFRETRKAVPALKMMHDVMRRMGYGHLVSKTSLHSIRKAAATIMPTEADAASLASKIMGAGGPMHTRLTFEPRC